MSRKNVISIDLLASDLQQIMSAFETIEQLLQGKLTNISPEDRQRYGSVNEQAKLFVFKAHDFYRAKGQLLPSYFDAVEYEKDFEGRKAFEQMESRISELYEKVRDTRTLLDYDTLQYSYSLYRHLKNMSQEDIPGIDFWLEEMSQFFKRSTNNGLEEQSNDEAEPPIVD
ncbi:hypothetical protein [Saprospira grandis]|uniref:Uncharacterized protein n=1 Tax=Saprospira grandis (strain Lewin) TaxID=984262 RepID=H6L4Q3_SAPGL|nr:hypothetical protein [Saprospira grandis]AFC23977.1 hypothetical protein SGRA_1242 [Saprospira grandis str. Lewin]